MLREEWIKLVKLVADLRLAVSRRDEEDTRKVLENINNLLG